jgi:hypothetical protein
MSEQGTAGKRKYVIFIIPWKFKIIRKLEIGEHLSVVIASYSMRS